MTPRQYWRYGQWAGGKDPLENPFDVRKALDEMADDVLSGNSAREALNRLLRRGADGRPGLDDLRPLQEKFGGGMLVESGELVSADKLLAQVGALPGLAELMDRLEPSGAAEGPAAVGMAAACLEFALEGLHLNKRLAKESSGDKSVYGQ